MTAILGFDLLIRRSRIALEPAAAPLSSAAVAVEMARRPRWDLCFAPAIETRFEEATRSGRMFHMRLLGVVGLIAYFAFAPLDNFIFPELGALPHHFRVFVATPTALALIASIHLMSARLREGGTGLLLTVMLIVTTCFIMIARCENSAYEMFTVLMTSIFGTVTLRLRFPWALVFTAAGIVAMVAMLETRRDLPQGLQCIIVISVLTCAMFGLVANWQMERTERRAFLLHLSEQLRSDRLAEDALALSKLSRIDAMTNLGNRRAFDDRLAEMQRDGTPFALLIIDVDHFKAFNDRYGHIAGDVCLQQVGRILGESSVRPGDLVARYGGEEFVVLLSECAQDEAMRVADRICHRVADAAIPHRARGDHLDHLTVSIGVATSQLSNATDAILQIADKRLYAGKRMGRNCIVGDEVDDVPWIGSAAACDVAA